MLFIKYGLLGALLASSSVVSAMWVRFNDCDLIDSSELVVSAEFINQLTSSELIALNFNTKVKGLGVLRIRKIYKGDIESTSVYVSQPSDLAPKSSNDIVFNKGQTGVWFLRKNKFAEGLFYYADHPQRYWPSYKERNIEATLNSCRNK